MNIFLLTALLTYESTMWYYIIDPRVNYSQRTRRMITIDILKKDEILNTSLAEFAEHGYEKTNTNKICKSAGVSKGLIFHYFGSKQKLYLDTVEKCIDDILAYFKSILMQEGNFTFAILGYYRHRMKFFIDNPKHYKLLMQILQNTPKEIMAKVDDKIKEVNELAMGILMKHFELLHFKKGVNREQALRVVVAVLGSIESNYYTILNDGDTFFEEQYNAIEKECSELLNLILYGIADESQMGG